MRGIPGQIIVANRDSFPGDVLIGERRARLGVIPGTFDKGRPLPFTGGSEVLLPASALLIGSGVLTYAILRRRP